MDPEKFPPEIPSPFEMIVYEPLKPSPYKSRSMNVYLPVVKDKVFS